MGYWNNIENRNYSFNARKTHGRWCTVCGKDFVSINPRANVCSLECRQELNRKHNRDKMRKKRYHPKTVGSCIVCGFSDTVDTHHEGKKEYILCPNHHALITRGIKKIEDLLPALIKQCECHVYKNKNLSK